MNLSELQRAPSFLLPEHSVLYRIQRIRSRQGDVKYGRVRVPRPGRLVYRFDLVDESVGYFAQSAETSVYETLARRETLWLIRQDLERRTMLALRTTRPILLLDLRPFAKAFPVLQSSRFQVTQDIAAQAYRQGYEGLAYRSAQQCDADCFALTGPSMAALRLLSNTPLIEPGTGDFHRAVSMAAQGSQIPVIE